MKLLEKIKRLGFFVSALILGLAVFSSCATAPKGGDKWYELGMMSDEVLDQVVLFYLGEAWTGMTDIGEVLETAKRVDIHDQRSWTREWRKTAERLAGQAAEAEAAGHAASAGELWLRTASYWRPPSTGTWIRIPRR
jgi:hypothetical protein